MPYRCSDCRSHFSIKTGMLLAYTQLPLRKWVYAIHLHRTSFKSVSSMKQHRDIGVSQKTAKHRIRRIRKAFEGDDDSPFDGRVEFDDAYVGSTKNMHAHKRAEPTGRGEAGKTAMIKAKDRETNQVRAQVVAATSAACTRMPCPVWTGACNRSCNGGPETTDGGRPGPTALWQAVAQERVRSQHNPRVPSSTNRIESWFGRFKFRARLARG